jgi:mono/diheme cytochrome c family protein
MARTHGWLGLLGRIAAVVVVLVALAYGGLVVATNRMLAAEVAIPAEVVPVRIPDAADAVAIERGRYLVDHALNCKLCHSPDLGGGAVIDNFPIGRLWAPNLTAGRGSVVGDFTALDWSRSIRHGLHRTGRRLFLMPSEDFFSFSDDDIGSAVAYVKSLPAVDRDNQGISLGPVGRVLVLTGEVDFPFNKIEHASPRPDAAPAATAEWGRVLGTACIGCHGPGFSGGLIPGGDPSWPEARNLTQHATGLMEWTRADFATALREGRRRDGTAIRPPMPWQAYAGLTDADIDALWLHLQSVTPKEYGNR